MNERLLRHLDCSVNKGDQTAKGFGLMRKKNWKNPKMSTVEFCQTNLKTRIAPTSLGSMKQRIVYAARQLGWSVSRTKDVWYADPRVSIGADELREIEELTGVFYGRKEAKELDAAIDRATALLVDLQKNSPRSLAYALVEAARILARTGIGG